MITAVGTTVTSVVTTVALTEPSLAITTVAATEPSAVVTAAATTQGMTTTEDWVLEINQTSTYKGLTSVQNLDHDYDTMTTAAPSVVTTVAATDNLVMEITESSTEPLAAVSAVPSVAVTAAPTNQRVITAKNWVLEINRTSTSSNGMNFFNSITLG